MPDRIPDGIEARHLIGAIRRIASGAPNAFAESTGYDVLFEGQRYPPKAVVGVAAGLLTGTELGPYDFKGGVSSKCFRVLLSNGFVVVKKGDTDPFPDEIVEEFQEGRSQSVIVNRFERDPKARKACIKHYGTICFVCYFSFESRYGSIGSGFIHVHHLLPLSSIGVEYVVDPIEHLRPVCPNCHAMLHKRLPPFSIEELKEILANES